MSAPAFDPVTRHVCTALIGPVVQVSTRLQYLRAVLENHRASSAHNERPGAVFVFDLINNLPPGTEDSVFGVYLYSMDDGRPRCAVTNFYDSAHWMMRDLSRGYHLKHSSDRRTVLYDAESDCQGALLADVMKWYSSERAQT